MNEDFTESITGQVLNFLKLRSIEKRKKRTIKGEKKEKGENKRGCKRKKRKVSLFYLFPYILNLLFPHSQVYSSHCHNHEKKSDDIRSGEGHTSAFGLFD